MSNSDLPIYVALAIFALLGIAMAVVPTVVVRRERDACFHDTAYSEQLSSEGALIA